MKKMLQNTAHVSFLLLVTTILHAQCFSTQNFTTSGSHTYTIPSTNSSYTIRITSVGADGGDYPSESTGGTGANMVAEFSVNAGDVLDVYVGDAGANGTSNRGGGGGGGSAIVLNDNVVLVASSGGGGATSNVAGIGQGGQANTNSTPAGGMGNSGGGAGGGGFNFDGEGGVNGATGGGQGTLTATGSGGTGSFNGGNGGGGFGGGGGAGGVIGGGGGGYKGGDGGVTFGDGGKGGDSFVSSGNSGNVISNTAGTDGGGTGNNGSVIIECISALPVELISFIAASNNGKVVLRWETASEVNNYGFEIQKSKNGIDWDKIGFVHGRGMSSELNRYEYFDEETSSEISYYRLKQIDLDGQHEFSKLVSFNLSREWEIQIFPNPTKNKINIIGIEEGQVTILDNLGKIIIQSNFTHSRIDVSALPSGIYFIQIRSGNKASIKKFIKE
ncbi:MAG: T9SS type A sorting domain-containing protein [Saprospiraceae bacterium]